MANTQVDLSQYNRQEYSVQNGYNDYVFTGITNLASHATLVISADEESVSINAYKNGDDLFFYNSYLRTKYSNRPVEKTVYLNNDYEYTFENPNGTYKQVNHPLYYDSTSTDHSSLDNWLTTEKYSYEYGSFRITIKDYFKTDYMNNDKLKLKYNLYYEGQIQETITTSIKEQLSNAEYEAVKVFGNGDVSGTDYNDMIDTSNKRNSKGDIVESTSKDTIRTGAGNDSIFSGKGDDTIFLGNGTKYIYFDMGDGNDVIYLNGAESVTLDFESVDTNGIGYDKIDKQIETWIKNHPDEEYPDDLYNRLCTANINVLDYKRNGNDLIIISPNGKNSSDTVTIKDYFISNTEIKIDTPNEYGEVKPYNLRELTANLPTEILGNLNKNNYYLSDTDGNDSIIGGNKNDEIYLSGIGKDKLDLKKGNDIINFNDAYSGENTLSIKTGNGTKTFNSIGSKLDIKREDNNLKLIVNNGEANDILINNYFTSGATLKLVDSEGTTTVKQGSGKITGTSSNDIIWGGIKNDTIKTGGGALDIVDAGEGNDKIYAQAKENILKFNSSFGNDTIYLSKVENNTHILEIGEGNISSEDIIVERVKNSYDVKLTVSGENNGTILLKDYLKDTSSNVMVKLNDSETNLIELIPENENILDYSSSKKGVKIKGSYLQEEIIGSSKKDTINAGGNLYSNTENAVEKITAGKGNDIINTGEGQFELRFGNGDGNDTVTMGKDSNTHVDFVFTDINDESKVTTRRGTKKSDYNLYIDRIFIDEKGKQRKETVTVKNFYKTGSDSTYSIFLGNGVKKDENSDINDPTTPTNPSEIDLPNNTKVITINKTGENVINSPYESGTLRLYRAFADRDDLIVVDSSNNSKTPITIKDFFAPDNKSTTYFQFAGGDKVTLNNTKGTYDSLGYFLEQTPNFTDKFDMDYDYDIYGTDNDDFILVKNGNNYIRTNDGYDIVDIESTSGKNYISGGSYNGYHQYIFNGLNSYTDISSMYSSSKSIIKIKNVNADDINLFYNVQKELYSEPIYKYSGNEEMVILDNQHKNQILKGVKNLTSGIHTNNLGDISIYQVDSSGKYLATTDIWDTRLQYSFEKNVQDYLKDRPYTSSFEIFDKGTTSHKQEMFNIYQQWFDKIDCSNGTYNGSSKNDVYYIQDKSSGNITISDTKGDSDILTINGTGYSTRFDVVLNKNNNGEIIFSDSNANYSFGTNLEFYNNLASGTEADVIIENYFGNGKIENISAVSSYKATSYSDEEFHYKVFSDDCLNTIAQDVANWLAENSYSSTYEVMDSNNSTAINELVKLYAANQSNLWCEQ